MDPRPARVVRHESDLGSWELVSRPPHPRLSGAVLGYAGYREQAARPVRRREVAQDSVVLLLNFGPPLRVGGPTDPVADRGSFVAGMSGSYGLTEAGGTSHGLQVDLSPLGAHMLLGVPMHELSGLVVPLEDVLPGTPLLVERLVEAPGWSRRFEMLDALVAARLDAAPRPSPDVVRAWRMLREADGRIRIRSVAEELGCSGRHLVARFREQVGPAPKTAARILRFRRTVRLLERDDGSTFAAIAQDCGYHDQAHMNREFRELAGTAPGRFLASRLPDGMGVAAG